MYNNGTISVTRFPSRAVRPTTTIAEFMGLVCLCTSYMRTQDTLICLK